MLAPGCSVKEWGRVCDKHVAEAKEGSERIVHLVGGTQGAGSSLVHRVTESYCTELLRCMCEGAPCALPAPSRSAGALPACAAVLLRVLLRGNRRAIACMALLLRLAASPCPGLPGCACGIGSVPAAAAATAAFAAAWKSDSPMGTLRLPATRSPPARATSPGPPAGKLGAVLRGRLPLRRALSLSRPRRRMPLPARCRPLPARCRLEDARDTVRERARLRQGGGFEQEGRVIDGAGEVQTNL